MTNIQLLKFYSCIPLLIVNAVWAQAQINESDTAKFQLRVSAGGNFQEGNVEVLAIKSRIEFTYAPIKYFIIKSQNSSLYQSFSTKKADNDLFSRNYFYYKPQYKFYPFAITYISSNFRRKIDTRVFGGAGITWRVLDDKRSVIKFSASAVYETTSFNSSVYNFSEYDGTEQINVWRGTLYVGGWTYLVKNNFRVFYDAYWQPAFINRKNYRTQIDIGIDISVWQGLTCNAIYSFTHENVTVINIKQDDQLITFGLAYLLKKDKN